MSYENNLIETLVSVFTVENGNLKVLLLRKKTEPYKGYWIIPGNVLYNYETLKQNVLTVLDEKLGLPNILIEQCYTFSNLGRYPKKRVLAVSYFGLIDSQSVKLKKQDRNNYECRWFDIYELPKLGYDHEKIITKTIKKVKMFLLDNRVLSYLFPSDFTLPELQRLYEQITNKKLDRRNFRKHMFNLNVLEETGYKNETGNGRPAKLYRFKNEINQDSKVEE